MFSTVGMAPAAEMTSTKNRANSMARSSAAQRATRPLDEQNEIGRQAEALDVRNRRVHRGVVRQVGAVEIELEPIRSGVAQSVGQLGGRRTGLQQQAGHRAIIADPRPPPGSTRRRPKII